MSKENNIEINCHYRDSNNNIKFFCDIEYQQGIEFVLTVHSREPIEIPDGCFTCYDGANNKYILNNLLFEENKGKYFYDKRYYFQSLIRDTRKHYVGEKVISEVHGVKFKSVYFTFPYINAFFYNIDYLKTVGITEKEPALKYYSNCKFEPISINNFKIELISGYSCGGGSCGGTGGHFDLIKSIKVSSNEEQKLPCFIEIITTLVNFFSICLKRKILISKIWSNENDNTLNSNFEIKTFQYYILNKDYQEDIHPTKTLATYALLKENFETIVNKYFQTKEEAFERFPVFCELYMRHNDAPIEILPQMKFLPLMQGLEAYVSKFDFNELGEIPKDSKKALNSFKKANSHLKRIDEVMFPQQLSFQAKINNTIKNLNVESIIKLKLNPQKNFKLISQMVKIRNYYTHYGDYPNIPPEDFNDAIVYSKIICEILIMKELNFTDEQIKISLNNNYYYLEQIDNKYCCLNYDIKIPKGFEDKIYVGEITSFEKNKYAKYMLFYKINKKEKQVELFAKNMLKYGRTQQKTLKLNISEEEYNNLNKIFKRCYDNYLETEKQIEYRNELKNKNSSN